MSLDDSSYVFSDQVLDGAALPYPGSNLRGGDIHSCHLEGHEVQLFSGPQCHRRKLVWVHPTPTYCNQRCQSGDSFGLLPFVKLRQLVRTQEKKELRIGIGNSKVSERVHGIGRPLPVQLHLTHAEKGVPRDGSSSHFHSDGGR